MSGGNEPENHKENEDQAEKLEAEAKKLEHEAEQLEEKAEKLEAEAEKLEEEAEELDAKTPIDVVFNDKYPVVMEGRKQTGLSLKQAAIAQKVPIQLDFVLSLELQGGKTELIGDTDHIKVKKGDRFLAIPNDDNS
jgi:predicted RNase H-like nuclease (RuvC/YqgF family)